MDKSLNRRRGIRLAKLGLAAALVLVGILPQTAIAQPVIPMQVFGDVLVGDLPAPDGTKVSASFSTGGELATFATTTTNGGFYVFNAPNDDLSTPTKDGFVSGDTVVLSLAAVAANSPFVEVTSVAYQSMAVVPVNMAVASLPISEPSP